MKAMRKILPALCMLLVSAVLLGSTTYAWFSQNSAVSASGMQISVSTPTSLLISTVNQTDAANFKNTATFATETDWGTKLANGVMPVQYDATGAAVAFKQLTEDALKKVPENGKYTPGEGELTEGKTEVFYDQFWLKVVGEDATTQKQVYFKLTVDSGNETGVADIWKAVHVAIFKGTTLIDDIDLGGTSSTETEVGKSLELDKLTANADATAFQIYVYVDGNDTDCLNANAKKKLTDLKLSIEFSLTNA